MGAEPTYDVFLSHKSEYKPWVEWLGRALQAYGRSVFLDIWNLIPGEGWVGGLDRGVQNCRAAILVATPEVVNSGWVRLEYEALQRRRQATPGFHVIPVVFGDLPNLPFLASFQAVDCRDPARYRDWFSRILCGLDGKEPGRVPPPLPVDIEPPPALAPVRAGDALPGEEKFVQRLMNKVGRSECPPILVAARGQRFQGPLIQALLRRATAAYGSPAVLHVTPPFSDPIGIEDCFAEIGRQCKLDDPTADATSFVAATEAGLAKAGRQFLLVTGFESAAPLCCREFAGALRSLTERQTSSFRVVLLGNQRLMEQKYATGELSFLGHASVEEWPQPTVEDVLAWQQSDFPSLALDPDSAVALLHATGAHAGLLRYCLERWDDEGGAPDWEGWSYACPELWETWYRLARNHDQQRLQELLKRDTLGPAVTWPADATVRALYWADLLSTRNKQLIWRADVVCEVGREVLA